MPRSLNETGQVWRELVELVALLRRTGVADVPEDALLTVERIWRVLVRLQSANSIASARKVALYPTLRGELTAAWRQALSVIERATSMAVIEDAVSESGPSLLALEEYGLGDREDALLTNQRARHICMVGCGPYPETLVSLGEWNLAPGGTMTGVDLSNEATTLARRVLERRCPSVSPDHISMVNADAAVVDFALFDLIVVANATRGKQQVVERIAATAAAGSTLLLRVPHWMGELLYDGVAIGDAWQQLASARPTPLSLSWLLCRRP